MKAKRIYIFSNNDEKADDYKKLASYFTKGKNVIYTKRNHGKFDDVRIVSPIDVHVASLAGVNLFVPNDEFEEFISKYGASINQSLLAYSRISRDKFLVMYTNEAYIIQAVTNHVFNVLSRFYDDTDMVSYESVLIK